MIKWFVISAFVLIGAYFSYSAFNDRKVALPIVESMNTKTVPKEEDRNDCSKTKLAAVLSNEANKVDTIDDYANLEEIGYVFDDEKKLVAIQISKQGGMAEIQATTILCDLQPAWLKIELLEYNSLPQRQTMAVTEPTVRWHDLRSPSSTNYSLESTEQKEYFTQRMRELLEQNTTNTE
jgi:hypothetical protein